MPKKKTMWITHSGLLRREKKTAGNESPGAKKDHSAANGGIGIEQVLTKNI